MGLRVDVEMLAVLLLLTPLVSDGLVVPKCELKKQLESAMPQDIVDREKLVGELVCHADLTSHFDTSRVNQIAAQDGPRERKTRGARPLPKGSGGPFNNPPPKGSGGTINNPPPKGSGGSTTNPPPKGSGGSTTNPPPKGSDGSTTNPPPKFSGGAISNPPPTGPGGAISNPPPTGPGGAISNPPPTGPGGAISNPPPTGFGGAMSNPPPMGSGEAITNPPPIGSGKAFTEPPPIGSDEATNNFLSPKRMESMPREPISQTDENMHPPADTFAANFKNPPPRPPPPSRKRRAIGTPWTMYGVFQLSDGVACTSPGKPSLNICNLSCDKLTDDDITDDINCVLAILKHRVDRKPNPDVKDEANKQLMKMVDMLKNTCPNMNYTQYFGQC